MIDLEITERLPFCVSPRRPVCLHSSDHPPGDGYWFAFTTGRRSWRRAARTFGSLVTRARRDSIDPIGRLQRSVDEVRNASFVELDAGDAGAIQLMNFSQTKGREADAVILSYGSQDWYGYGAAEPYDEPSRLLYVSMTRARHVVTVLLPPTPHALVAPFLRYAR